SSTIAKARTGNEVPPAMAGGAAVKRKPEAGSSASAVRCSTMGMPAQSRVVCAGRSGSSMSSTFAQSIPTSAAPAPATASHAAGPQRRGPGPGQRRARGAREEGPGSKVPLAPPAARPAGAEQHRSPRDAGAGHELRPEGTVAGRVDDEAGEIGELVERDARQVL